MSSTITFGSYEAIIRTKDIVFFEIFRDQEIECTYDIIEDGSSHFRKGVITTHHSKMEIDYIIIHLKHNIQVPVYFLPKGSPNTDISVDGFAESIEKSFSSNLNSKLIVLKKVKFKDRQKINEYYKTTEDKLYTFTTDWVLHPTLPKYIY